VNVAIALNDFGLTFYKGSLRIEYCPVTELTVRSWTAALETEDGGVRNDD
jgi:hypothetical protein